MDSNLSLKDLSKLMGIPDEAINTWGPHDRRWEDNFNKLGRINLDYVLITNLMDKNGELIPNSTDPDVTYYVSIADNTALGRKETEELSADLQVDSFTLTENKDAATLFPAGQVDGFIRAIKQSDEFNVAHASIAKEELNADDTLKDWESLYLDAFLVTILQGQPIGSDIDNFRNNYIMRWLEDNKLTSILYDLAKDNWDNNITLRGLALGFELEAIDPTLTRTYTTDWLTNFNNLFARRLVSYEALMAGKTLNSRIAFNKHLGELRDIDIFDDITKVYAYWQKKLSKQVSVPMADLNKLLKNIVLITNVQPGFTVECFPSLFTLDGDRFADEEKVKAMIEKYGIDWNYQELAGLTAIDVNFREDLEGWGKTSPKDNEEEIVESNKGFLFRTGDDQEQEPKWLGGGPDTIGSAKVRPIPGQSLNLAYNRKGFKYFDSEYLYHYIINEYTHDGGKLSKWIYSNENGVFKWLNEEHLPADEAIVKAQGDDKEIKLFTIEFVDGSDGKGKPEPEPKDDDTDGEDAGDQDNDENNTDDTFIYNFNKDGENIVDIDILKYFLGLKLLTAYEPDGRVVGKKQVDVTVRPGDIVVGTDGMLHVIMKKDMDAKRKVTGTDKWEIKPGSRIYRFTQEVVDKINALGFSLKPGQFKGKIMDSLITSAPIFDNDVK